MRHLEAILFDYDGTLAVLNLDFAAMRRHLHTFTIAQGISPQELHGLDILEMLEWATGWLRQHSPALADRYARDAEQLIQDMEVEAASSSGLLPGVPELLAALRHEQIGVGIVTRNCDAAVRVTFPRRYLLPGFARNRVLGETPPGTPRSGPGRPTTPGMPSLPAICCR
jgi:phosphoglycolate phosphatase